MKSHDILRGCMVALVASVVAAAAPSALAQDVSYQPINPSFGGNPFNSSHLLAIAAAQNTHTANSNSSGSSSSSSFIRQLESRLLASLSSGLTEAITGAAPGTSNTIIVGDQQIYYERTLDSIRIVITNLLDGSTSEIVVPVFDASSSSASSASASDPLLGGGISNATTQGAGLLTTTGTGLIVKPSAGASTLSSNGSLY